MKKSPLLQKYFQDLPLLSAASPRALYFLPPIAFAIKRKAKINSRASARGLSHRPVFPSQPKQRAALRSPFVLCLQVISDADFVLANSDAARRHTSPLVKQGIASDRYLPGCNAMLANELMYITFESKFLSVHPSFP